MNQHRFFRASKFAHFYERNAYTALYHSLFLDVVYMDLAATHLESLKEVFTSRQILDGGEFEDEQSEIIATLVGLGFLVSCDYDEEAVLSAFRNSVWTKPQISVLYLVVTDVCNLACNYCFIINERTKSHIGHMTWETAKAAIDLFVKHRDQTTVPSVTFYGGEPLLNWEVISQSIIYLTEYINAGNLPKNIEVVLITNGTLLEDSIIDFLLEYNIHVALSFDGAGTSNNQRPLKSGNESTDRVMSGYYNLKRRGVNLSISGTLNDSNLPNIEDIARWICEEKINNVGFNLLIDTQYKLISEEQVIQSVDGLIRLNNIFRRYNVYEDRLGRRLNAFTKKRLHLYDCAAYGGQLVIAPSGDIGLCHAYLSEKSHFVANVHAADNFTPAIDATFEDWRNRSPINMPSCFECPALGNCGGGCARCAELRSGSIWGLDSRYCIYAKKTLEWMIWDRLEQEIANT